VLAQSKGGLTHVGGKEEKVGGVDWLNGVLLLISLE
jgi:hypothetical protein